jgi:uncharacterized protein YnzC (UPF0291/DUF896 family)
MIIHFLIKKYLIKWRQKMNKKIKYIDTIGKDINGKKIRCQPKH